MKKKGIPWFLWPLATLLRVLAFIVGTIGRAAAALAGLGCMALGGIVAVCVPLIWWAGVLLAAAGFLLLLRSV